MYEKLSMEIYELMEQKKYPTGNRDMISMEMNELELETEYVEKLIHSYACAKQQKIVDEYTRVTNCLWKRLQFIVKTRRSMSLKEKNWVDICILIWGQVPQSRAKC